VLATAAGVAGAQARQTPTPPPSGIVVHLFGPESIMSNVLPTGVGSGGGTPASGAAGGGAASAGAGTLPYVEPSTHDILHEMFVTGDPDLKPGTNFAKGRTGNE